MNELVIQKTLLLAALGMVYAAIKIALPDFPLSEELFATLVIYVLVKAGVEITEARVMVFLRKRGLVK